MNKKPVKPKSWKKLPYNPVNRQHKKWCGKVDWDENGYCSAVVPLFYAGVPDHRGRIFTKSALQDLANSNPTLYRFDNDLDALVGLVGNQDVQPTDKLSDDRPMVPLADLPDILMTKVLTTRDDLANETDALVRHLFIPYAKVWVLLCKLIDSRSLTADDLCQALKIASRVGNDPDELITVSYNSAGVVHGLVKQFLSPYDPNNARAGS